jgi:hypothetical protein
MGDATGAKPARDRTLRRRLVAANFVGIAVVGAYLAGGALYHPPEILRIADGQVTLYGIPVVLEGSAEAEGLRVRYYPRSYYAGLGLSDPGYYIVDAAERPGEPFRDLSYFVPFGGDAPDPEAIAALIATFQVDADATRACRWPADKEAVFAGECQTWCGFLTDLAIDRIGGRRVDLHPHKVTLPSGEIVQSSEGHTTLELRIDGRWALIDPALGMLGAYRDDERLDAYGLILAAQDDPAAVRLDLVSGITSSDAWAAIARLYAAEKILRIGISD